MKTWVITKNNKYCFRQVKSYQRFQI